MDVTGAQLRIFSWDFAILSFVIDGFLDFDLVGFVLLAGHQSATAYAKYDRSKEAKIWAAQRCAAQRRLTYV